LCDVSLVTEVPTASSRKRRSPVRDRGYLNKRLTGFFHFSRVQSNLLDIDPSLILRYPL
jgi:hypothetical protein